MIILWLYLSFVVNWDNAVYFPRFIVALTRLDSEWTLSLTIVEFTDNFAVFFGANPELARTIQRFIGSILL